MPRDGRFIENIGMYDPNESPAKFAVDEARWAHWTKMGAQPSETVSTLYKKSAKAPAAKA
jgi:small subunit ribosomal protein S16